MDAVLIGGPFDGATATVHYAAPAVGVYPCDGSCGDRCPWRDGLHWCDWRGGRKPGTEKYVLEEIGEVVSYVYGYLGDSDPLCFDWVADALAA